MLARQMHLQGGSPNKGMASERGSTALLALRTAKNPPVNGEGAPFSACTRDVFSGLADAREAQVSVSRVALPAATPAAVIDRGP